MRKSLPYMQGSLFLFAQFGIIGFNDNIYRNKT